MAIVSFRRNRKKIFLIFVALYIALSYSVYNIIIISKLGLKNYSVIPLSGHMGNMSDMSGFASVVKRSSTITSGDLFTNKYKGIRGISPNLSILIVKYFSQITGSITGSFILLNVLMPVLYLLLVFVFFNVFLKIDYMYSLLAGVAMLTISDITNSFFNFHFGNILHSFFNFAGGKYQYSYFGRIPNIEISFIFILLFFMLFMMAIKRGKIIYIVFSGISYGILFYVYFYFWIYATVFIILFMIISLVVKEKKHVIISVLVLISGIIIGAYYIFLYIRFRALPFYGEYVLKLGARYGHAIEKKSLFEVLIVISTILFFKRRKTDTSDYIIIAFLSVLPIVMNIQVITGYTIEPEHFRVTVWTPFFILFCFYYMGIYFRKKSIKPLLITAILFFPMFPLLSNINFAYGNVNCHKKNVNMEKVCNFINSSERGKIIAASDVCMNALLSRETDNPMFLSNGFYNYLLPKEILRRESILLKIEDRGKEYLDSMMIMASIEADCKADSGDCNERAWMFYFLHTYYFDYSKNKFVLTEKQMKDVNKIYGDSDMKYEKFDILVTKDTIADKYKNRFRKVYESGVFSVFIREPSPTSP